MYIVSRSNLIGLSVEMEDTSNMLELSNSNLAYQIIFKVESFTMILEYLGVWSGSKCNNEKLKSHADKLEEVLRIPNLSRDIKLFLAIRNNLCHRPEVMLRSLSNTSYLEGDLQDIESLLIICWAKAKMVKKEKSLLSKSSLFTEKNLVDGKMQSVLSKAPKEIKAIWTDERTEVVLLVAKNSIYLFEEINYWLPELNKVFKSMDTGAINPTITTHMKLLKSNEDGYFKKR